MKALSSLLLLALSVALFFMVIHPTYDKITALRSEQAQYEAAITRAKQAGVKRDDLINRYASFSTEDQERLIKLLPDNADNIRFIVDLNSMASKYGSTVKSISITTNANPVQDIAIQPVEKPYQTTQVSFQVSMSYENFLKFLREMEKSLRIIDVSAIDFIAADKAQYNYTITAKTYSLK